MTCSPVDALRVEMPALAVRDDDDARGHYGHDWARRFPSRPTAVAFPKNIEEVRQLVLLANRHSWALVPSGGRTGLSGGAAATEGELVVSLERMRAIHEINPLSRIARVQAGVVTAQLAEAAREEQLCFPIDFASSGSSTLGGNAATNAGGVRVLRYGSFRDWVVGLTAVTGAGDLIRLRHGLVKDATGYDLRHLLIGSEGTLALICELELLLTDPPPERQVLLLALPGLGALGPVLQRLRAQLELHAFEFFDARAMTMVCAALDRGSPFDEAYPMYALVDFPEQQRDVGIGVVETLFEEALAVDGVVAESQAQAKDLWSLREEISASLAARKPYKNDISVRIDQVEKVLHELASLTTQRYADFETTSFGHLGDGNIHFNVLAPETMADEEFAQRCAALSEELFALIARFQGSISAEHGVGLLKKPYLHYSRSDTEIDLMRNIKRAFDPNGILNPGKIFDLARA